MKKIIYLMAFFLLTGCAKEDLCSDDQCKNGSSCNDGKCDCPPGFIGDDCSIQDIPRVVIVSNIKILSFPKYNENGGDWDPGGFPDLFVAIFNEQSMVWISPDFRQDASNFVEYNFSSYPNIHLTAPISLHEVVLFDYDDNRDEYMGSALFVPYTYGFPNTLKLQQGSTTFELTLSYVFY